MSTEKVEQKLDKKIINNSSIQIINSGKNSIEEIQQKNVDLLTRNNKNISKISPEKLNEPLELSLHKKNNSNNSEVNSLVNENNNNSSKLYFKSKKVGGGVDENDKICCNCTKTKCIKKYCECFASNKFCNNCNCIDCLNTSNQNNKKNFFCNQNIKDNIDIEKIICTCSKSNCTKKYCDCFKSGKKCTEKCKCSNCYNTSIPTFNVVNNINNKINNNINNYNTENNINNNVNNDNNQINQNEEINKTNYENNINEMLLQKQNINEENKNNINFCVNNNSDIDFMQIQRVSVFINKSATFIEVERFSEEDMKILNKKRKLIN